MRDGPSLAGVWLSFTLSVAACRATPPEGVFSCASDYDCPAGQVCYESVCWRPGRIQVAGAEAVREDDVQADRPDAAPDAAPDAGSSEPPPSAAASDDPVPAIAGANAAPPTAGSAPAPTNMGASGVSGSAAGAGGLGGAGQTSFDGGSADASAVDAGPDAGAVDAAPPICPEGEARCTGAERELCSNGAWTESPCRTDEVCVSNGNTQPGTCLLKTPACRGKPQRSVCDSSGTMYLCDEREFAYHTEQCETPALCTAGLAISRCAMCVPGTFRCSDRAVVQECQPGDNNNIPPFWMTATTCVAELQCGPGDPPCP
jgi:hypothetical protein